MNGSPTVADSTVQRSLTIIASLNEKLSFTTMPQLLCPNCGSRNIEIYEASGASVCTECGIVVEDCDWVGLFVIRRIDCLPLQWKRILSKGDGRRMLWRRVCTFRVDKKNRNTC